MAQKPSGTGVTQPASVSKETTAGDKTATLAAAGASTPSRHQGETTQTTATTGTTLVGEADRAGEDPTAREGVVVAPSTPTKPPVEEVRLYSKDMTDSEQTAGVTSSAVQPPGSGSALLSTPHRPNSRKESDSPAPITVPSGTSSAEAERTETSGGYSDISESDLRSGDEAAPTGTEDHGEYAMDEEYEDEEDRLIAQGGMGIPLDEVGFAERWFA